MLVMAIEVIARYVFDNPTVWAYDTTYQLSGIFYLFAASFVLLHRGDIRVDLFYARFSTKKKKIIDLALTPLLFFSAVGVLTQQAWFFTFRSIAMRETIMGGVWEPSIIPFRFLVAIGFSLLAIAGVTWFIRDVLYFVTGKETSSENHD